MTKIAIISQPEQGLLIDVGGCVDMREATQHLTTTLQVSSEFWENVQVDLNLGQLVLTAEEIAHIIAILAERGIKPRQIFADRATTIVALAEHRIMAATGKPMSLPVVPVTPSHVEAEAVAEEEKESSKLVATQETIPVEIDFSPVTECGATPAEKSAETENCSTSTTGNTDNTDNATTATTETKAEGEPTAEAAPPVPQIPQNLYLKQNLRAGQCISHKGNLIIIGDVNPGAEVMAEGDITIWGALRGVAHAGIAGNTNAQIRALRFEPIQLRIAHAIARSPDRHSPGGRGRGGAYSGPETARIVDGTIRITSSAPD